MHDNIKNTHRKKNQSNEKELQASGQKILTPPNRKLFESDDEYDVFY